MNRLGNRGLKMVVFGVVFFFLEWSGILGYRLFIFWGMYFFLRIECFRSLILLRRCCYLVFLYWGEIDFLWKNFNCF